MIDPAIANPWASGPVILAIGAAVAAVIGAMGLFVVQVTTSLRLISKATAAIEGHVNSEKTKADGDLAASRKENELLRERVNDLRATAGLLAQDAASRRRVETLPESRQPVPVEVVNVPLAVATTKESA